MSQMDSEAAVIENMNSPMTTMKVKIQYFIFKEVQALKESALNRTSVTRGKGDK